MDYMGSTLIVFAILIAVAVAAVVFEPSNPLQRWVKLTEQYGTHDQPSQVQFTGQQISFGGQRGGLKPLNKFVSFDATIDEFGLWLVLKGAENPDITPAVRVPGTHVRPVGQRGRTMRFDLFAEPPVRIGVTGDLAKHLGEKTKPS
jgi:hypothetical protein